MKTWIASWKPYFSLYRLKAMQETQYRAAALGGLVTQAFFGLLYVFLYTALFRGENQAELAETITYVWLQQMFFRVLLMNDTELIQQVMTGGLAYAVLRPVDQYRFAFVRNMAQRHVNALMRLVPMIALQFLLPTAWRMQPPESLLALMQAFVSLLIGVMNLCAIAGISGAILMQTMDNRGINAIITFISNAFAGNIIPLTLFPDSVQAIIRYQPFAQSLDAPIRMYLHAQAAGEWALNIGVQDDAHGFLLIGDVLHRLLKDVAHRLAAATHFTRGGKLAFERFGQDGLQVQQRAECRRRRGDASAALEVLQVIHCEPRLCAELVVLQPLGDFLHRFARAVHLMRLEDENRLRRGDGQRVHHDELAFRILLQQFLARGVNRLNGRAELAGEGDEEQVAPGRENRLEVLHVDRLVERGGCRLTARAHLVVEGLMVQRLAEVVEVLFAIQGVRHVDDRNVVLLFEFQRQVAVAVCHENVILHGCLLNESGMNVDE